jgi:hypothetical protein
MRDIKKRYFLSPPLVDADYISLGSPGDAANKGCRIWYTVTAPEEAPPENPEDLRWSYYIKEVLSA